MDILTAGIMLALAALLVGLGAWRRRAEAGRDNANRDSLRECRERGQDRATAQYPMIRTDICLGCGNCVRACPEHDVLGLVDGVSTLIHAHHCIGHGKCQEVCPVGALVVSLGDTSRRPDIPLLSPELETSVLGVYIAGELGGIALVRHAVEQGTRAVDDIARRLREKPSPKIPDTRDLLVVGAGPAGLAATFRAVELGLDVETISLADVGGTVRKYPRRKLTLVQPVHVPLFGKMDKEEYLKEDLLAIWEKVLREHKVPVRTGAGLVSIAQKEGFLETLTTAGPFRSRFVVLALGRRGLPRKLGVPGEDSERVLYELSDAASYTGQRILVVGGGDSAVEAALALAAQPGNKVSISYRKPEFVRLKKRNEDCLRLAVADGLVKPLFSSQVKAIEKDSVTLSFATPEGTREERLSNDWVFVFAGGEPPFPLLQKIGICFGKAPEPAEAPEKPPKKHY